MKRLIQTISVLGMLMYTGCAQDGDGRFTRSPDEQALLRASAFFSGQPAPAVAITQPAAVSASATSSSSSVVPASTVASVSTVATINSTPATAGVPPVGSFGSLVSSATTAPSIPVATAASGDSGFIAAPSSGAGSVSVTGGSGSVTSGSGTQVNSNPTATSGSNSGASNLPSVGTTTAAGGSTSSATSGTSAGSASGDQGSIPAPSQSGTTANLPPSPGSSTSGSGGNVAPSPGSSGGSLPPSSGNISAGGGNVAPSPGSTPASGDSGKINGANLPPSPGSSTGSLPPSSGNISVGGGNVAPSPGCGSASTDHGQVNVEPSTTVSISRICSRLRSQSEALFYEEAVNPIISVEAVPTGSASQTLLAGTVPYLLFGNQGDVTLAHFQQLPNTVLVAQSSLRGVDLFSSRFTTQLSLAMAALRQTLSANHQTAIITATVCDDLNHNGKCSDESLNKILSLNVPEFTSEHLPSQLQLQVWTGRGLTRASAPSICETQYSPIVMDLGGNGIHLTSAEDGVMFDLNATGNSIPTAWLAGSDNAFLVRDLGNDGIIASGAELLGTATRLKNAQPAADGFQALRDLAKAGTTVLTPKDPAWSELKLWIDRNQNAISEKGELVSLDSMGIESINLQEVPMSEVDAYGNETRLRSTFIMNSKPHLMVDVWFNTLVESQ